MDDKIGFGVGGLILGGLIVWALMSATVPSRTPGMMNFGPGIRSQMMGSEQMDAHFIEQMIPHHEDAITMAKLALEKAQHAEIKQLAQNIIESQSAEIEQMKAWYKDWYGQEVPSGARAMMQHGMMGMSGMHMGMMGDDTDITLLSEAADFDRGFIEQMIPHHQMAVMMASILQRGTQRPEMQQLAQNIIAAQTSEIDEMRQWYDSWY
jgi:Uncharacterized protein conserved in bacteria